VVVVADASARTTGTARQPRSNLDVALSPSLLPALMPLLARLRQLFDLDAEPLVVDAHLATSGLKTLVRRRAGLRIPGAFDGFEIALGAMIRDASRSRAVSAALLTRVVRALGESIETGWAGVHTLTPSAARVADAGAPRLKSLGASARIGESIVGVARAIAGGTLVLDPSGDSERTRQALLGIGGVSERAVGAILTRALHWPDAFPRADRALEEKAERWRPWRAYAALHLQLQVTGENPHQRSGSR
jgi:AraC family transcriptional regulator of adaptative response / DNA-3-methyladenine glycosylase II